MITPAFVFTVFMVTLGPVKTIPAFFAMTRNQEAAAARRLALNATVAASVISLVIALVMTSVAASWRISPEDLRMAGGILLFAAAREMIGHSGRPGSPPPAPLTPKQGAVTPLAIPIIVTPWGATAILFFADLAYGDAEMSAVVIGMLVLTMALNLVGMLLARQIIARIGMAAFQVVGWIFAVLQAGLAVDAIVTSLRNLWPFPPTFITSFAF